MGKGKQWKFPGGEKRKLVGVLTKKHAVFRSVKSVVASGKKKVCACVHGRIDERGKISSRCHKM